MALFQKLYKTVSNLARPEASKDSATETTELSINEAEHEYAVALQTCLIGLANEVYGVWEPKDISAAFCAKPAIFTMPIGVVSLTLTECSNCSFRFGGIIEQRAV